MTINDIRKPHQKALSMRLKDKKKYVYLCIGILILLLFLWRNIYYDYKIRNYFFQKNVNALFSIAKDKKINLCYRIRAIVRIGEIQKKIYIPELLTIFDLANEPINLYDAVSYALSMVTGEKYRTLIFPHNKGEEFKKYWSKILQKDCDINSLIKDLSDDIIAVRYYAVQKLGEIKEISPIIIENLLNSLHDQNEYIRLTALDSLAKIGKAALPYLEKSLNDKSLEALFPDIKEVIQEIRKIGNIKE